MSDFTDLPELASDAVGGAAIASNDDFFAERECLVRAHAAEWREHAYTDRGKWMDGWETRRRRPAPGPDDHDWCIVRLGMPGAIRGVVVDTAFFRGNFPSECALYAAECDDALDLTALASAAWTEVIPRAPLTGNAKNAFPLGDAFAGRRFTHVRLDIYPDGGVARLRIHGDVIPRWSKLRVLGGPIDLAALEHGAVVETCSDMFFGSRNNLIKPGPSRSMADGWETRRRRGPGNDWALVRLAAPGTLERIEIDTSHFKGNAPGACVVEGRDGDDGDWRTLVSSPLQPHTRHVFDELRRIGRATHVRLSVFPDGGVARLRAWGALEPLASPGLAALNALDNAAPAFLRCCGALRWADAMNAARPFEDAPALLRAAERIWWSLSDADHREAFAAHPAIGAQHVPAAGDARWSAGEQSVAASSSTTATQLALAEANRQYLERFGFTFIICATGRSSDAILAELQARLASTAARELRTAAEEQLAITRLRLTKLLSELA